MRLKRQLSAEDIWQETLCMAWRDREKHRWQGPRSYRGWLLAIAKNRIRDAADRMDAKKRMFRGATLYRAKLKDRLSSLWSSEDPGE